MTNVSGFLLTFLIYLSSFCRIYGVHFQFSLSWLLCSNPTIRTEFNGIQNEIEKLLKITWVEISFVLHWCFSPFFCQSKCKKKDKYKELQLKFAVFGSFLRTQTKTSSLICWQQPLLPCQKQKKNKNKKMSQIIKVNLPSAIHVLVTQEFFLHFI